MQNIQLLHPILLWYSLCILCRISYYYFRYCNDIPFVSCTEYPTITSDIAVIFSLYPIQNILLLHPILQWYSLCIVCRISYYYSRYCSDIPFVLQSILLLHPILLWYSFCILYRISYYYSRYCCDIPFVSFVEYPTITADIAVIFPLYPVQNILLLQPILQWYSLCIAEYPSHIPLLGLQYYYCLQFNELRPHYASRTKAKPSNVGFNKSYYAAAVEVAVI